MPTDTQDTKVNQNPSYSPTVPLLHNASQPAKPPIPREANAAPGDLPGAADGPGGVDTDLPSDNQESIPQTLASDARVPQEAPANSAADTIATAQTPNGDTIGGVAEKAPL